MKKIIVLMAMLTLSGSVLAQSLYKTSYVLADDDSLFKNTLYGNGIVDLLPQNSIMWVSTGYGLSKATYHKQDEQLDWRSFDEDDYISKGGVSAMALMPDDSVLWVATAFDTSVKEGDLPAGGGLSYTRDGGTSWTYVSQPIDSVDEQNYAPTTTVVQNLTYDIAFIDGTVWIASFGGGLRRSDDMGQTWQVVTTDGLFFSSNAHYNHRAFSLLTVEDTLWVGTAEGISKTPDNGQTWERFTFSETDSATISGDFVVALAYQQETHSIWAATVNTDKKAAEFRAVSKTSDWGKSWQRLLTEDNLFAHNFAFNGEAVYVASDLGLDYSNDAGQTWQDPLTALQDHTSGQEIFQEEYYSAAIQDMDDLTLLWLGSSDGLAYTVATDNLTTADWNIVRSFVSTKIRTTPKVYAYPSPFSPSRHYYARFQFDEDAAPDASIKIYDFAMEQVVAIPSDGFQPKWDGRNDAGDTVASGVYFFRAKVDGKVTWGKIVVIN